MNDTATHHDENTLRKVYDSLTAVGVIGQTATDAVNEMQNRGIFFREDPERAASDQANCPCESCRHYETVNDSLPRCVIENEGDHEGPLFDVESDHGEGGLPFIKVMCQRHFTRGTWGK